jgi:oligosaccharide reducing-end xylanase
VLAALLPSACTTSLDAIGCGEIDRGIDGGAVDGSISGGATLAPLRRTPPYVNAFREFLGRSDSDIANKVGSTFNRLFHGDPSNEAIFFPVGTDQAYILDVLHDEVRSEGIGLGMLITVELDKRDEFDKLWRYAKAIQIKNGPARGYFPSYCNSSGTADTDYRCNDPFGLQQIATTLLLARGRWQSAPGDIDYGGEAAALLDIIRYKQAYNCGIVDEVTGTFDPEASLPYDTPTSASANISRPSIVMPAYYDLWAQATGDAFWSQAASAGRAYWRASAHPRTGLVPLLATFDGKPVPNFDIFGPESVRTFFNMALDRIWSNTQGWLVDESNRVLQFFYGQGLTSYGQSYSLDGMNEIAPLHDMTVMSANGVLALAATYDRRAEFVNEVWNLNAPTGNARYYAGITYLLSLRCPS